MAVLLAEEKLSEYTRRGDKQRETRKNVEWMNRIADEGHDWPLKPRNIVEVARDLNLTVRQFFSTRQKLQLRIAEVCRDLHKISRWSPRECDEPKSKANCNKRWLCARVYSGNDPFIVKSLRTFSGWKVLGLNCRKPLEKQLRPC